MIKIKEFNNGTWVFLSHSHLDYDKVIQVRNFLESRKFKPLMFFLKCLEKDQEIDSLIKREIDCRNRFILCDSKNAQESRWVQEEVRYIKEDKLRMYEVINLDTMDSKEIMSKLSEFENTGTVTVISHFKHRKKSLDICNDLESYNFKVNYAEVDEAFYNDGLTAFLKEFATKGYVIFVIGEYDEFFDSCIDLLEEFRRSSKDAFTKKIFLFYARKSSLGKEICGRLKVPFDKWFYQIYYWDINEFLGNILSADQIYYLSNKFDGIKRVNLIEQYIINTGRPTMYFLLSRVYEYGEWGLPVDYSKALEYLYDAKQEGLVIPDDKVKELKAKIDKQNE